MKRLGMAAGVVAMSASSAIAGGVERAATSPAILFEKGNYAELSYGNIDPSVSGVQAIAYGPFAQGSESGDITPSYQTLSVGVKTALSEQLHLAVIIDQPIGAKVNYPAATGYIYGGSNATISATAVTAMLRYQVNSNVSVYGGLKAQSTEGKVALFNGYTMSTSKETDYGYLVGAAYEKPEIALRVALTYVSAITHDFDVTENGGPSLPFSTEVPQGLNLDFQSGVAANTLVFGSIRWREWSAFDITPFGYFLGTGDSLVSYEDDTITYSLGVGRKFNDNWAGAVQIGHEKSNGGFAGNLGPTDGYTSIGLGVTYTRDAMKITGGVSYAKLGDAQTESPAPFPGTAIGDFTDNSLLGFGVKVGFSF